MEALEGRALLAAGLTEFAGPYSVPVDIATGSDGNLWVLNGGADANSSLTVVAPDGTVKGTYAVPTPGANAASLTPGPDGNLWFVEQDTNKVGKVTPSGVFTEYAIPNTTGNSPLGQGQDSADGAAGVVADPTAIVAGADGALWFTEKSAGAIGRVTTGGVVSQFPTPGLQPTSITVGPDKSIWFTDTSYNSTIDRLNGDGTVSSFPLPTTFALPIGLTTGPDGALWFVEEGNNAVGRMTTDGKVTETPILGDLSSPEGLAFDASGNLWVTGGSGGGLARMTPQGQTTIVGLAGASAMSTEGIIVGAGGMIWFTDTGRNAIGEVDPNAVTSVSTDNVLTAPPGSSTPAILSDSLSVSGPLVTFLAGKPSSTPSDFTATVQWGDGTSSPGTVSANGSGRFVVSGGHSYTQLATYPVTVTVDDVNPADTPRPDRLVESTSVVLTAQPDPVVTPVFRVGSLSAAAPSVTRSTISPTASGGIRTPTVVPLTPVVAAASNVGVPAPHHGGVSVANWVPATFRFRAPHRVVAPPHPKAVVKPSEAHGYNRLTRRFD